MPSEPLIAAGGEGRRVARVKMSCMGYLVWTGGHVKALSYQGDLNLRLMIGAHMNFPRPCLSGAVASRPGPLIDTVLVSPM